MEQTSSGSKQTKGIMDKLKSLKGKSVILIILVLVACLLAIALPLAPFVLIGYMYHRRLEHKERMKGREVKAFGLPKPVNDFER